MTRIVLQKDPSGSGQEEELKERQEVEPAWKKGNQLGGYFNIPTENQEYTEPKQQQWEQKAGSTEFKRYLELELKCPGN